MNDRATETDMRRSARRSTNQQGFTLAEVIVAVAVFVVIFVAALALYDRANRVYATGSVASDLQQNTRVAFEKLVSDVRMAGFDYDRDGIPFSSAAGVNVWRQGTVYGNGDIVTPTINNGFTYQANAFVPSTNTSGTSGPSEPTWSTSVGGTTTDNGVVWTTLASVVAFEQPDEQIEYAGNNAITIRANFDFEVRKNYKNGRENGGDPNKPNLESQQFPVVTTGNDEIVTYALQRATGASPDAVEFYADVPDRAAYPGGRAENLVHIGNVDLCSGGCNNPPYNLMRINLKPDGTPQYSIVATNIRSLQFQYYGNTTGTGTPLAFTSSLTATTPGANGFGSGSGQVAASSGGGQYDPIQPTNSMAIRQYRATIQSVRVILTGMGAGPAEAGYRNPAEATGSPAINYRTYTLQSLIVPRNLGKIGQRALQDAAPGPPAISDVCISWCGIAKVDWVPPTADSANGTVEQYVIFYDTVSPPVQFQQFVNGGTTSGYVYGLTPGTRYFFQVASVNSFGTAKDTHVLPATAPGLNPINELQPAAPSSLQISGSGVSGEPAAVVNEVDSTWMAPTTNLSGADRASCVTISGTTTTPLAGVPPGEIDTYNVFRSTNQNFTPPGQGRTVSNITAYPKNSLSVSPSSVRFIDKSAVPCVNYYYRVQGVKSACNPANGTNTGTGPGNSNPGLPTTSIFPDPLAPLPGHLGLANPSGPPATPDSLLPPLPSPTSSCGVTCTIYSQWPKVKNDNQSPPNAMTVEDYVLTRERWKNGALDPDPASGTDFPNHVDIPIKDTNPELGAYVMISGQPYYADTGQYNGLSGLPSVDPNGVPYKYHYRVKATLAACTPAGSWDSGVTPDLIYPCPYTAGAVNVNVTNTVAGDGLSYATAWESDGSGTANVHVTASNVQSVQVFLRDFSGNNITDLGTQTSGFNFPIQANVQTVPGDFYQIFVVTTDTNGCLDIKLRYYEEGTATGCCLAAASNDPFVLQFTPGANFVDVFLINTCGNDLNLQPSGIGIQWNPALNASSQLKRVQFPQIGGGTVNGPTLNDTTGSVVQSVPSGGVTVVTANTQTYKLRIFFNGPINVQPITGVCISYQRTGIDLSNQNCKIVPQPSATFNSCN